MELMQTPQDVTATEFKASARVHNRRVADHNGAIIDWTKSRVGAMNGLRRSERGILEAVAGLEQLVGSWAENHDPFMGEQVHGIARHLGSLLNYDLGRLMPEVLSDWLVEIQERTGVDADTGQWIGQA